MKNDEGGYDRAGFASTHFVPDFDRKRKDYTC